MAVTHLPEPHPSDPVVQLLTDLYARAYAQTMQDLQVAVARGLSTRYKAVLFQQLARRVAELRSFSQMWAFGPPDPRTGYRRFDQGYLYQTVAAADREALVHLSAIGVVVEVPAAGAVSSSFAMLNDSAVRLVAQNLVTSLDRSVSHFERSVTGFIGRAENDLFRRTGLETVGEKLTSGLTVRQARVNMVNELSSRGIPAFTDSRGRDWNLKSYADMAVRTTTREATSTATLRRVQGEGHDYLMATQHRPTCALCAVRQGRVYCISGRDERFPALATVGNTPWHANCGHSLTAWSENYEADLDGVIATSNKPLDVDPRSAKDVKLYEQAQKIKTEQRRKRQLSTQLGAPGLPKEEQERLRRLRASANRRLIKLNKEQREALPGWR